MSSENEVNPLTKDRNSLSKHGPFNQELRSPRGGDSRDSEYQATIEERLETKQIKKKTLSRYGSHSIEKIIVRKEGDSDEEYGAFDPTFKPEKVAHTSKGELIVIPENPTPKVIKKTLSKYGTPSSAQKTPVSVRSGDSDDDYGVVSSNGEKKNMKKSLSKYSPKSSANNFEGKLSFEEVKVDSDEEEYGVLDPNFKPEPIAKDSAGHLVAPPDPNKKVIKKTLSKYESPSAVKVAPIIEKSNDSDEDYGVLEGNKVFERSPVAALKNESDEEYGNLEPASSDSVIVRKSASEEAAIIITASAAPVKALVAKIEASKDNRNDGIVIVHPPAIQENYEDIAKISSTESLDMSLNALKIEDIASSNSGKASHNNSFHGESASELKTQTIDYTDPNVPHETKLISLIAKGYTRDQAEEYIVMLLKPSLPQSSFTQPRTVVEPTRISPTVAAITPAPSPNGVPRVPSGGINSSAGSANGYYADPYYAYHLQQRQMLYPPQQIATPEQRQLGIDDLIARGYTPEQATAIYERNYISRSSSSDQGTPSYPNPYYANYAGYYGRSPSTAGLPQPVRYNPYMPHSPLNYVNDEDEQALRIAMLVSEQEAEFGVNMYQVVTSQDDIEIQALVSRGFTADEAILWIFEKRGYRSKKFYGSTNVNVPGTPGDERSESSLTKSIVSESPATQRDLMIAEEPDLSVSQEHKSGMSPEKKKTVKQQVPQSKSSFFHFASYDNTTSPASAASNPRTSNTTANRSRSFFSTNKSQQSIEEKEIKKALKYREKDVRIITELGFSREQAVQALIENNHNVPLATNSLLSTVQENEAIRVRKSRSSGSGGSHNNSYGSLPVSPPLYGAQYAMMYYPPQYHPGMMIPPPPVNSISGSGSQYGTMNQQPFYPAPNNSYSSHPNSRINSFYATNGPTTTPGLGDQINANPNSDSFYQIVPDEPAIYNRTLSTSNDSFYPPNDPRRTLSASSNGANGSFYKSGSKERLSPATNVNR